MLLWKNRFTGSFFIYIVPLATVVLFAYTGTAKLIDPAVISGQLQYEGIHHKIADLVALAVPVAEILTALLIAVKRFRLPGLALAAMLLFAFTLYVAVLLAGSHRPCSCGGILEAMSWQQHLVFNSLMFTLTLTSFLYHFRTFGVIRE